MSDKPKLPWAKRRKWFVILYFCFVGVIGVGLLYHLITSVYVTVGPLPFWVIAGVVVFAVLNAAFGNPANAGVADKRKDTDQPTYTHHDSGPPMGGGNPF